LDQIAHIWVNVSRFLRLFGREIIFEVFQRNNGVKYIYLLPLNSLFDTHCQRYRHQLPFKMVKLYIVRRYVSLYV